MSIQRAVKDKDHPYFQAMRNVAQDENLSWEARGVMFYLLSKPDDWKVQPKDLQQHCGQGKVYRILAELKEAGYLTRMQGRDSKQRFGSGEYFVHEKPQVPDDEKPDAEKRQKPDDEKPDAEKRDLTDKREEQKTESMLPAPLGNVLPVSEPAKNIETAAPSQTLTLLSKNPSPALSMAPPATPTGVPPKVAASLIEKANEKALPESWCVKRGEQYTGPFSSLAATERFKGNDGVIVQGQAIPSGVIVRKPNPSDVLFNAVAKHFFDSVHSKRVGWVMWGNPTVKCTGIVAYECQRQGKDKASLDYEALANDVATFKIDYQQGDHSKELKECGTFVERWEGWRNRGSQKRASKDGLSSPVRTRLVQQPDGTLKQVHEYE